MPRFLPKILSVVLLTALAPLTMGLGNPEYVPATGTLKLKAVDIDGVKVYENVEIVLDMATGTFTIPKASLADNRIPELPVQEITKNGLKVGLRGCIASSQSVTCHVILTAIDFNTSIKLGGSSHNQYYWETSVVDNKGNNYYPNAITVSNTNGTTAIEKTLIANVPTAATITMQNVSLSATSLASIFFKIGTGGLSYIADYEFRNVPF